MIHVHTKCNSSIFAVLEIRKKTIEYGKTDCLNEHNFDQAFMQLVQTVTSCLIPKKFKTYSDHDLVKF